MADAQGNRYGPYDIEVAGSEAEALTEEALFDLLGYLTGVKSGGALTFAGLTATLAPIDVRVHGSYLIRADPWSVASPATPSGGSPRRDMLVARRQRTSGEGGAAVPGKTFLLLLQGTPAATPVDPDFDPDDDEPLWSWQVPGNAGTVVTGIRDYRRPKCVLSKTGLSIPVGNWTRVSGWVQDRRHPHFTVNSDGTITFSRDGVVRATARASSDDSVGGWSSVRCALPGGTSDFTDGYVEDARFRGSGFAGAGLLRQPLSWAGRVDAGQTTALDVQQISSDGNPVTFQAYLSLEYTQLL